MPITFSPEVLKDEFIAAVRALNDFAEITLNEWEEIHEEGFDFDDPDADLEVTLETKFEFDVGANGYAEASVAELISLARELPKSKVVDHQVYVAPMRAFVRVEAANERATQFVAHLEQYRVSPRRFVISSGGFTLALVNGYTPFAIHMMKLGEYDSETYPTFHDYDLFVELNFPAGTKDEAWRALVPAFLFEIDEQTGMAFASARRPLYEDLWPEEYDENEYIEKLDAVRLRPLMSGPGVESLLRLYERAIGRENDPEQHFVGFVKVIEYVSATVVNTERNAQVRRRLLTPRALAPDAGFIGDLVQLVESLRNFKKDAEALRLTIEVCCDPVELARFAPPHQRALGAVTEASSPSEREKTLKALAATLSATRNMFSHAKANYALTGDECPEAELPQLTRCARAAAQQCVRWFAHSDVSLRIVD
jgi:hypothetical protein